MNKLLTFVLICFLFSMGCVNTVQNGEIPEANILQQPEEPAWYLQTNDENVQLFVKDIGVGDTIVVVHGGFGAEHSYLKDAFNRFYSNYHFVFYDQRGSLRSPAPNSVVSIDKHIADIERLRTELGLKKLNLVGHSMGTFLCGYYASKYPDKIRSMILLALVFPKTPETDEDKQLYSKQQKLAAEFFEREAVDEEIIEEGLNRTHLSDKEESNKWRIQFAGTNILHVEKWRQVKGGQAFYSQSAGSAAGKTLPESGWDFTGLYDSLDVPITVINGVYDFADMKGKLYSQWLKDIDNLEYQLLDSAGHNAWIDRPQKFNEYLEAGLRSMATDF